MAKKEDIQITEAQRKAIENIKKMLSSKKSK